MTDCIKIEIRDMLPDYLHGVLAPAERERVEAHLRECGECAAELQLLASVRDSYAASHIDVVRVARAVAPYKRSRWINTPPMVRIAAGIALLALGSASYSVVSRTIITGGGAGESTYAFGDSDAARGRLEPIADPFAVSEDLSKLDDASLEALLADLNNLDASIPVEPRPMVKSIKLSGN